MAGKDTAVNAGAAESRRRLWRVVRAVLYMMRRGVPSGRKLAMDLHVLLRCRAGKSVGGGLASTHHHHAAVHEPSRGCREVEFSWRNAPASSALLAGGHLGAAERRRHHGEDVSTGHDYDYDEAEIARMFEMLNDNGHLFDDDALSAATLSPPAPSTPSSFGRSPTARQMCIADSPFAAGDQEQVDVKADEFIRRFYEQLRAQKSVPATPDCYGGYATTGSYNGHSARSVAAGMA